MSKAVSPNESFAKLPQSLEAEIGVLGAMLIEECVVGELVPLLRSDYFLVPVHRFIYEAICALFDSNQPITYITVQEELKRQGKYEQVGGASYLATVMEAVPSAGNSLVYAKIVREKGVMRRLLEASKRIQDETLSERLDLDSLLDDAERAIFEITQSGISSEPIHIKTLLFEILSDIESRTGNLHGISTGFPDLDRLTAGLQKSSLIIIAGRPSMGKTSFALNLATHVGLRQGKGVLIFSLEMSKEQVCQNMLCSQVQISSHKIQNGSIDNEEYRILSTEVGWLSQAPIYIDDSPGLSLREIRAKTRRMKAKQKIELVIIDYIQLIETAEIRNENRQQEISQISRGLKGLARELAMPVIALSQLNRAVDSRDDHRPRMSDLRESGALEQDADLILFLYREEYYNKDTSDKGTADVLVAKHRNGPTGDVKLAFVKEYMRFFCTEQRESFSG